MKSFTFILLLMAFTPALAFQQQAETKVVVSNSVLGNGGDLISGGGYRIAGTVGQPFVGVTQNPDNVNRIGFWYLPGRMLATGVEQTPGTIPDEFRLQQNYPNPFNPATIIQFALPQRSAVTLKLYDVLGREVATMVEEELAPGVHKVTFGAKELASGVYFYRLVAEGSSRFVRTRKLMLLK